jgi:RNA polymerase sigma-70 factor (ECF subfamily)
MDPDITQLIHQISKRKPEALAKIMDIYMNNVYSLAKSILSHISTEEDIEECVQDTFLDAWIYIDRYNPDRGTFKTWLLILCKYRALNIRRARLNKPQEVELDDQQSSIYLTPENEYLIKEGSKEILSAINHLAPIDREIFIRRFILDQRIDEISAIMKLSRQAIDNRLWRGRTQLKEKLAAMGGSNHYE